jgi:hypothetical protein
MSEFLKRLLTESARLVLGVLVCASVVAGVAYAASMTEPTTNPPTGNVAPPVNVGVEYQEKTGDFWADAIGSTDGFCIGASCITAWPAGATGSSCQLNTMIREDHNPSTMGANCNLSAQEVAGGWTLVSWDNCSTVRSADCSGPSYCVYQQVSCTGNIMVEPGIVTQENYVPPYAQGYYGGGGCFSPETLVTMADGTQKNIVDVKFGDRVLSADEVTGQLNVSTVTKVWKHTGEYKTLRINDIVVTPEHRFKVQRNGVESWLHARDIHVGDSLITTQGIISVTSVSANEPLSQVYNLTTVPSHTYFAGGVLVHNIKDGGGVDVISQQ